MAEWLWTLEQWEKMAVEKVQQFWVFVNQEGV